MIQPVLICSGVKRICGRDYLINTESGLLYPVALMRESLHLFRFAPCYRGHTGSQLLGIVTRAVWSSGAGGVIGLVQPQSIEAAAILAKAGGISGFYADLQSTPLGAEFRIVNKIGRIASVDTVDTSLMGGRILEVREAEIYLKYS